jgi:hypothetical protein
MWHRKPAMWCAQSGAFFFRRWRVVLLVVLVFCSCMTLFTYGVVSSGELETDPSLLLKSTHYVLPETDPSLFRWHGGVADANVSQSVPDARRGVSLSKLLVLHSKHDILPRQSVKVKCSDLLSPDAGVAHVEAIHDMTQFAAANIEEQHQSTCTCAPLFGKDLAYVIVASKRSALANPEQVEAAHKADGVLNEHDIYFEHILNPEDAHQLAYDTLNGSALEEAGVDLVVTNETDNHRYNEPQGHYMIIRRKKIVLALLDRVCHHERLTLSGHVAVCVQYCLDVIRGITVRERALIQYKVGIRLNEDAFFVAPPRPTPLPQKINEEL